MRARVYVNTGARTYTCVHMSARDARDRVRAREGEPPADAPTALVVWGWHVPLPKSSLLPRVADG